MAIVDKITPETIERLRGIIDFYMLRGILPVARKWPKKPKPPYTALQAEAMAVFAMANSSMHRLTPNMLETWQATTVGVKPSWTDVYRAIIMKYWKLNGTIAPIALDYNVIETDTEFKVVWDILQLYIDPLVPEELYSAETTIINKEDIILAPKPIYFTLSSDDGIRLVAPNIKFEVEA
ncbi:hypothetical protein ES708_30088 [subsurface metagenome]